MFAHRDEALAMAGRFFRTAENGLSAFLLDEKGYWLAPAAPPGLAGEAMLHALKEVRPQIAGWLRRSAEGEQLLVAEPGLRLLLIAVSIEGEAGLRALALPLTGGGFEDSVPSASTLLGQVEGIAFATDGREARSRGSLGAIQGSGWQPEGWHELWSRLLILTLDADQLPKQAAEQSVRTRAYSMALCAYVEVSAGKAGKGIAGWVRLPDSSAAPAPGQTLFSFFTYAGNPALQLPIASNNPVALALSVHLASRARRDWALYLAEIGRDEDSLTFSVEFESGDALFAVEVASELVYGPRGTLVGHHHVVYLVPDPVLASGPVMGIPSVASAAADPLAEAEMLTREANHRIKNSLSMAASLLQLQSYTVENQEARDALLDSVQRLYTVSDLHEALYRYTNSAGQDVEMKPFLESIVDRLRSLAGTGIELRTEVEAMTMPGKIASRIGLLINELVLNAVKYAFPGGRQGFVALYLTKTGNEFYLSVQDNGQGMEARSTGGATSLGNTLISEFAKQLQAQMRLETQAGTRYVFTFTV